MPDPSMSYEDDTSILDDAELWRRIPPWHIVEDKNRGGKRISKAAFEDHPDGTPMSVMLGEEVFLMRITLDLPDLIIAQNARQNDGLVYSLDKHFQLLEPTIHVKSAPPARVLATSPNASLAGSLRWGGEVLTRFKTTR